MLLWLKHPSIVWTLNTPSVFLMLSHCLCPHLASCQGYFLNKPGQKLYKALEQKSLTELSFIISSQTQFRLYQSPFKVTQSCFALFCCLLGVLITLLAIEFADKISPHNTDKGGPLCTSLDSISVVKEKLNWTRKK